MSTDELSALRALTFNWTRALEEVWAPSPYHVDGLHGEVAELIRRGIGDARNGAGANPLGVVLRGERGVGKTHLLGWVRQEVQRSGGYFFLVSVSSGKTFWEEVLGAILDRLQPHHDTEQSQMEVLLGDLAGKVGLTGAVRDAVTGRVPPSREDVETFIRALREMDRSVGLPCQDAARALVLLASPKQQHQDVGYYFLSGVELEQDERRAWGIRSRPKSLQFLVGELSRLLALSGPTVVAVDQIDPLIDDLMRAEEMAAPEAKRLVAQVASGLMTLRDMTRRTLTIVSCLPDRWEFVRKNAVDTVTDRFRHPPQLQNIPNADIGRTMIEKRFAVEYAGIGFAPPYPTWPIRPPAFAGASNYTARQLLKRIEEHVAECLREGVVRELDQLDEWMVSVPVDTPAARAVAAADLAALDARFAELYVAADAPGAFDPSHEDETIPGLLAAGLDAWIRERGEDGNAFVQDPPPGRNPQLHACLRQTIDEQTERQRIWGFRAISSDNAKAVLSRLRRAVATVGLDGESAERRLFILRNTNWPTGPTTDRETRAFAERGGVAITVTGGDLKTFKALRTMLDESDLTMGEWLKLRRPAHNTELLGRVLPAMTPAGPLAPRPPARAEQEGASQIRIGTAIKGAAPEILPLESLRTHTMIIAGTGSGKTVLIRRLIEECALRGVSAIVLDPNNDLARLGDAWPEAPGSWLGADPDRAREYLANTDVVVWTPRRKGGRPLVFQPLPAFADILDSPDEFDGAVDAAVEALAPRVNADKATDKAKLEKAVLTGALRHFGRNGGSDLGEFISLLAALPEGASTLGRAPGIAADLAEKLEAARVNDPLFGGYGQAADPGLLLTPPAGKRARVSVISLIGLAAETQRQSFVNQLQMALFSWIKKHPATGGRPLGGLFVMDEAQLLAPSTKMTVCTESTLRLASQARKYGLGLVFATQAPRGLHNQIPGNATTHFYGRLNSGTQIKVAQELARARGSDLPDLGRMSTGQFYSAPEGRGFKKIQIPMCLSHHPPSPLTEEEVIARSCRNL
jgi:hypothetical protein